MKDVYSLYTIKTHTQQAIRKQQATQLLIEQINDINTTDLLHEFSNAPDQHIRFEERTLFP